MIQCPSCNRRWSDSPEKCPECGAAIPQVTKQVKRPARDKLIDTLRTRNK